MNQLSSKYLESISEVLAASDFEKLNFLISEHLNRFSFNNVEVLGKGNILNLESSHLQDKILVQKGGGYCFEQNGLFFDLLKEQGFDAESKLARVVYNRDIDAPKTHRFTLVRIESLTYLVDVGFGPYTPNVAVPIDGTSVHATNGDQYRVVKINEGKWQLEVLREDEFFSLYQFDDGFYTESDFKVANYYTNTHPESKFVNELVVSRKFDNEIHFINNLNYVKITGTNQKLREDRQIQSSSELKSLLSDVFQLNVEEDVLLTVLSKISRLQ